MLCEYSFRQKAVDYFYKRFHLRSLTAVLNAPKLFKVKRNPKVWFTFNAMVKGKANTYVKMKKSKYCKNGVVPCKSMWKMVWINNWNNCSVMFRKIGVLEFLGRHAWWRSLLLRCAACSLKSYLRPSPS